MTYGAKMSKRVRVLFAVSLLATFALGCGRHYEEHDVQEIKANGGGRIDDLTVSLPEGAVLTAKLIPLDNDEEPMSDPDVRSDDPNVLGVLRVADGTSVHFAFVGRAPGRTTVRYFAESRQVRQAPAIVSER